MKKIGENCNKLPLNVTNLSLDVYAGPDMVESPSVSGISRVTAIYHEPTHLQYGITDYIQTQTCTHREIEIFMNTHLLFGI